MGKIVTQNHGPLVASSSYWGSAYEAAGKVFCTVNAGVVRVLLPRTARGVIPDMRAAPHAVLSRGPWPAFGLPEAVELLFDDGSDSPFALHLSPESFDLLPAEPPPGQEWVVSVWDLKKGRPHKCLERPCHWRRVPQIPWLRRWEGRGDEA